MNSFISNCNLYDVNLKGARFTWFGPLNKKSRLDRVLLNLDWIDKGEWSVQALDRSSSDHKGLLLLGIKEDWGPKPFKIFNCWLEDPELKILLDGFWSSMVSNKGNVQLILKNLKTSIKDWSLNCLGDLDKKIFELENLVNKGEQKNNSNTNIVVLRKELDRLIEMKMATFRQRARIQWQLKGDRNTKFYHRIVQRRNYVNGIKRVHVDDYWIYKIAYVKRAFYDHYKNFFSDHKNLKVFYLGNLKIDKLSIEEGAWFERDFYIEEIEWALNKLANEKAPGPDGFNVGCLKKFWPHIKESKMQNGGRSLH